MTREWHKGRVIDHVHLRVRDLEASRRFYRAAAAAIGMSLTDDEPGYFTLDELFVSAAGDGPVSRVHLAFQASSKAEVAAFHAAALARGGRDNGPPGPRDYHPGYYGAFVLDPDGNNVEAVWHGPMRRSAESVAFIPESEA